ncbi:MAG: hypothetical protein ACR2KB_12555 [Chitinophagaceae bacterium]
MKYFFLNLLICLSITSCAQSSIKLSFLEEIKYPDKINVLRIDTLQSDNIVFYLPITNNQFANKILLNDKKLSLNNPDYLKGTIQYKVKQVSNNFISVVKDIYIEDDTSPKGYFSWKECLNFFRYYEKIYEIEYILDENEIYAKLIEAVNNGKLEKECLEEDRYPIKDMFFYFSEGKLYVQNPIIFPICWLDVKVDINENNLKFKKM